MEEQTNLKTIALKDLWDIFVKRIWIMLLAAIVAGGAFFAFTKLTYVPEYSSKATLYILNTDEEGTTSSGLNTGITVASKMVSDCTHFLKSHKVLDSVITDLNLDIKHSDLAAKISTNNPTDTRFLEVTVKASTPEEAKVIVDAICDIGSFEINETLGINQVNLYEHGILNQNAVNKTSLTTYILVALVAAVLVYGIFFVMFMLDDSVWTDDEIDKYLGLSVLGDIPDANSTRKKGYGYGKYKYKYGSYGKYGAYSAYSAYGYNAENEKAKAEKTETKNNGGKK
ncbi:MAG: hypothetical protein IJW21_06960 [Clostridia bacterium]|nr:hypothetical protein [Clostridia bacterium]